MTVHSDHDHHASNSMIECFATTAPVCLCTYRCSSDITPKYRVSATPRQANSNASRSEQQI